MTTGQDGTKERRAVRAAALLCAGIASFQLLLAAGVPWGRVAYGGGQAELTDVQRMASGGAVLLWSGAAIALLAYSGELAGGRLRGSRGLRRVVLAVVAVSSVGVVVNLASPSLAERLIWTPVALGIAVLSVRVVRSVQPSVASLSSRGSTASRAGVLR